MSSLEILLYAAIAAFLLARLWSVLGQRHDDEPQRPNPFTRPAAEREEDEGIVLPGRSEPAAAEARPNPVAIPLPAPESLAGGLRRITELDPQFDEKKFLQGAKAAFAMIVTDFAKGDLAAIEYLLSPKVAAQFRAAIAARAAAGQTLEHKLLALRDIDTMSARVEGSRALLGVRFISDQENILRAADGQITSGAPGQSELIEDDWIFMRDTATADPNWQVVETRG